MVSRILTIAGVAFGGIIAASLFVTIGCVGANPPLIAYCGHNPFGPAILVAITVWFLLGTIVLGLRALRSNK